MTRCLLLDVHPPHESIHGWRDFTLHLVTITIGLLIALSLEGLVEWEHHRHLAHDAEISLHAEIKNNASGLPNTLASLRKQEDDLKHAADMIKFLVANKKMPNGSFNISYDIVTFDSVSWKTAQTTGALSFMPYDLAKEYSSIYATQDALSDSERQASQNAVISIGWIMDAKDNDPDPTPQQAEALLQRVQALQGQLLLVDNFMKSLSLQYQRFLAAHPE